MKQKVVVVGAGINGLVAANYLQRGGCQVTLIEKKPNVGGACAYETFCRNGRSYDYPSAATVFGFMQDFVFEDTGLAKKLSIRAPQHAPVVWFEPLKNVCYFSDDIDQLVSEVKQKWGEQGNVPGFYTDLARVRQFLVDSYRAADVPTIENACKILGESTTELWISGSARNLMDHYFSSDAMKVYCSIEVTESGPVSLDSPYSAFTIPLMSSGSVFAGGWGFVKGGLWKLTEELAQINRELGVEIITSAQLHAVLQQERKIIFEDSEKTEMLKYDDLVFATDPLTASGYLSDNELVNIVDRKKCLGTSGKLVMLFDRPIQWQNDTGNEDFDSAFKFIVSAKDLDEIERTCQSVIDGHNDFIPGYFELYCEGAGMRSLGADRGYDALTVFFKNLAFSKKGEELPQVKKAVEEIILSKITNPHDHAGSILLTPRDLNEKFYFPGGNIDHIELSEGQTFFARTFSPCPENNFYQFGSDRRISYCAAGSFPCGSIGGTSGYMCASQLLKAKSTANA